MAKKAILTLGLVGTLLISACSNETTVEDDSPVVDVNDVTITESEFVETLKQRHGDEVLRDMIQTHVLNQKADELNITNEDIEEEF